VDAGAGGRGARAEVDSFGRRRVGDEAGDGALEELAEIGDASGDVAADVVFVVRLESAWRKMVSRENPIAKTGAKRSICDSMAAVMSSVEACGT
jgi:hypothetical protein